MLLKNLVSPLASVGATDGLTRESKDVDGEVLASSREYPRAHVSRQGSETGFRSRHRRTSESILECHLLLTVASQKRWTAPVPI